jgi:hypothetical protein
MKTCNMNNYRFSCAGFAHRLTDNISVARRNEDNNFYSFLHKNLILSNHLLPDKLLQYLWHFDAAVSGLVVF